jgi:hypothetical protein
VNYTTLRELLQQKKWKEADLKTSNLIQEAVEKQNIDYYSYNELSCEDLRLINREWLTASSGKFGFSVQLAIYKQTGNPIGSYSEEAFRRFGYTVGWRAKNAGWQDYKDYSTLNWDKNAPSIAPLGHLPAWGIGAFGEIYFSRLMLRVVNCSL